MTLGDGIRRNIVTVSQEEQIRFRDAILKLHQYKFYPDGVSYWFKQDQIHQATHVHGGASFVPWHRVLVNKFEQLLREVDGELSLHYWDWTQNPETINLLGPSGLMGASHGMVQSPFDILHNNDVFAGSRNDTQNPADPPQRLTRDLNYVPFPSDQVIVTGADSENQEDQWSFFRQDLELAHGQAHGVIGGNILSAHNSFEDPFVFLLHGNVDRLWAKWQLQPGKAWRLDPEKIYGFESDDPRITEFMEPWAGGATDPNQKIRPWGSDFPAEMINSKDPSVVTKVPKYDK
jgi:hypothetical protein